jgi:hypothetical protein
LPPRSKPEICFCENYSGDTVSGTMNGANCRQKVLQDAEKPARAFEKRVSLAKKSM